MLPKENIFPFQPKTSLTPEILKNGLYRFTDAKGGYYFDYPSDALHISVGKNKGEIYDHLTIQFSSVHGYGYQGMMLYVIPNPKKLSLEEFLLHEFKGTWTKQAPPINIQKEELGEFLNLNGHTAIKTTLQNYIEIETSPFFIYIHNGDKIIATGPMYGILNGSKVTPASLQLFNQILNTLSFIP